MIPWLPPAPPLFPDTRRALADPNGLLAAGGSLTVDWLLAAYRRGIFPWFNQGDPILWWSPAPRMVLRPSEVHVSRSLRKSINKRDLRISFDRAFAQVISHCSSARSETWIVPEMQSAYLALHRAGFAHSVEIWRDDSLVGGLYGVCLGRQFFGESMFSLQTDASKIALVALARHCQQWQINAIDCQMHTPHLASLGARLYERPDFEAMLEACDQTSEADWVFRPEWMYVQLR